MNNYGYVLLPVLVGISGCGGGDAASFAPVTQQEFSLPSGAGAASATDQPGRDGLNYNVSMFVYDEDTANKVVDFLQLSADNDPSIVVADSKLLQNGIFEVDMSATNSKGETGTNFYRGMLLATEGYVSYNLIEISNIFTVAGDGTVFSGSFPATSAVYTGEAYVDDRGGAFDSEFASVTLTADFSTNKADLDITGSGSYVSASGLDIDPTQGRIDGSASMGLTGGPAATGAVLGYFAGQDAEGVHGIVYGTSDTVDTLDAAFFGVR